MVTFLISSHLGINKVCFLVTNIFILVTEKSRVEERAYKLILLFSCVEEF